MALADKLARTRASLDPVDLAVNRRTRAFAVLFAG
jgi:hypothetical protein